MPQVARCTLWLALTFAAPGFALQPDASVDYDVRAEVAFSPGDDPARVIIDAVHAARRQALVQAFSFTHKAIARALVDARARGVDVQVIADGEQTERIENSVIDRIAAGGVPVFLDRSHAAAHNKVIVIDDGEPYAVVITGSFNFTFAAQYRNAENVLVLRGAPRTAHAYAENWQRHRVHSLRYRAR